ncbi:MAG: aldehyde dehydrogenase family protein [Actinobacteria bacterium]|jgi:acyl-CoA reductase-like NAD-dependent aldehyde dehydrogenase|nr:aldehyde dehydrogenase family protein [Actinomycetota bacterium]MDB2326391.1 aldehyde dehydrogenase family protein [Candidatus Actinomarina sp.]MDB4823425.1 aldehyde dehydrogenase family protein [Acidimicrobiia bacterium]
MNEIKKTYKNYVGGKYVRSESGKTFRIELKNQFYEVPLTSRKDVRDAVVAAKKGYTEWQKLTPYNKTQVLYRLSEMVEGNSETYQQILQESGLTKSKANQDIKNAIDSLIWYAGMADKWEQMTGNLNPVAGDYFNISHQESLGVVFTLNTEENSFNQLLLSILPSLTTGCSVISFSGDNSILALKLAEDINNSDLPSGALNILSGNFSQIIDDVSNHVEINAMAIYKDLTSSDKKIIRENASKSLKRIVIKPPTSGLESLLPFIETKTVWHPKGR